MSVSRIAGRYAKSLLDLAIEGNKVDQILEDIKGFDAMLESKDLSLLLSSPIVSKSKKEGIFQALFGAKFDELTMSFFKVLLTKGREEYLPNIASEFLQQYKAYKGITDVTVVTAAPADETFLSEVKAKLIESGVATNNVEMSTEVDEDIIGGFVLQIGDQLFDNSIAHKLNEMKKQFADNKYVKQI